MATKANPGQFDCYAAADENEPLFTLRANDPFSDILVNIWIFAREKNVPMLLIAVSNLVRVALLRLPVKNVQKLDEARGCALKMAAWRETKKVA